ncbi:SDR family NAD(P)-dependent oxidoreductase [Synechococcus sp. PCC 7336]|uniref:SDR family NAD(P)-dependent oxidoreductase n=1 Tax=Synechococcus sp. PCC 7336 TaxID=195250 RepID=UPI00034AB29F|nr:SDR family oxidoreductase [Synechococcus sp. PCC 7336]
MESSLSQKVIVLTGASRGIGRAVAIGLSKDEAKLVLIARSEAALQETIALCHGEHDYIVGDVRSESNVKELFDLVKSKHDRLDMLINNAGVHPNQEFLKMEHDDWLNTIGINLFGVALCTRHALMQHIIPQERGKIVNIVSRQAMAPVKGSSAYSVSKMGVSILTKALAVELEPHHYSNISICDFIPGPTKTSMCPGGQPPENVYPMLRNILAMPASRTHGKIFLRDKLYNYCDSSSSTETWKDGILKILNFIRGR